MLSLTPFLKICQNGNMPQFAVMRAPMLLHGTTLGVGEVIPPTLLTRPRLRQLYEQRRITPVSATPPLVPSKATSPIRHTPFKSKAVSTPDVETEVVTSLPGAGVPVTETVPRSTKFQSQSQPKSKPNWRSRLKRR